MEGMNVTVSSDASFYYHYRVGGYAYQIKSNDGLIKKWGPLKGYVQNPTMSEVRALIHALKRLVQKDYKIYTLTINVDCQFIVYHMFEPKEGRNPRLQKYAEEVRTLLEKIDYKNLNIKHVKAHSEITSSRRFVNNWCDKHSRQGAKIAIDIKEGNPLDYLPEGCLLN